MNDEALKKFGDFIWKNAEKEPYATADLKMMKAVLLYFSANWCPPCKLFLPKLVETYNALNAGGKQVEIIFVSNDESESAFLSYYKELPFPAIPFDSPLTDELPDTYAIPGIPVLLLLKHDGTCLTKEGRRDIIEKGVGCLDIWNNLLL